MLNDENNRLLTQTGPGTPMGDLMRQYWVPALASSELEGPDSDPVRVMLLGERLIAFRDSQGRVGLMPHTCPHRGASLFLGRNEESGLRCVYHGWKFDVTGQCVDMPNEPAESNFKVKVRARAYPCEERGGIVWAYLGPREVPPPLPAFEALDEDRTDQGLRVYQRECNWLQALEGDLDTSHAGFLHLGHADPADAPDNTFIKYAVSDRAPRYKILNTDFGATYAAYRQAGDPDHTYWRFAHFLFPFYAMTPTGVLGTKVQLKAWVPMDDEHVLLFQMGAFPNYRPEPDQKVKFRGGTPPPEVMPNTTDWFGRFRLAKNDANDYLIDRDLQRSGDRYSGIVGIHTEDQAVTESMGPVYDRSQEHLGTSDVMVIRVRRRLMAAANSLAAGEIESPPIVDEPNAYRQRSGGIVLANDEDWIEATSALRSGAVDEASLDVQVSGGI